MNNVRMWIGNTQVEKTALEQIKQMSILPILGGHIAIMPDVHWGMGATVGSVIPTKGAIIPAAVGVDIGCGMVAARTNLNASDLPDSLIDLRHQIERDVPVGFSYHKTGTDIIDLGRFGVEGSDLSGEIFNLMRSNLDKERLPILNDYVHFNENRLYQQMGTLGGGTIS